MADDFSETNIQPEFYSPWPKFGKPFSRQLNESRQNTDSLHPIVRAHGVDPNYTEIRSAAVAAVEIGETNFHNRYRIWWDKTNTSFRVQKNTGTTGDPLWSDQIVIGSSGTISGNFYASSSSGGGGVTDHGLLEASSLLDDDHPQYLLASAAGSRALFATNWTDLTDSGSTTLHSHAYTLDFFDGINSHTSDTLNVNPNTFYLTKAADGETVLNLENVVLQDGTTPIKSPGDATTLQIIDSGTTSRQTSGISFNDRGNTAYHLFVTGSSNTYDFLVYEPGVFGGPGDGTVSGQGSNSNRLSILGPGTKLSGFADPDPYPVSNQLVLHRDGKITLGTTSTTHTDYTYHLSSHGPIAATSFYVTDNQGSTTGAYQLRNTSFTTTDLGGAFTPPTYSNKKRLIFNRAHFYLTPNSTGEPIVNLAESAPLAKILIAQASAQSFANLSETEVTNLTTTIYNTGGWTSNGTRVTIPSGISAVRVIGQIEWDENATNSRIVKVYKNGSGNIDGVIYENSVRPPVTTGTFDNTTIQSAVSGIIPVVAGDTISFAGAQDSGSPVTSQASGSTWLYVEEVRVAGGSITSEITLKDGTAPNYTTSVVNLNPSDFYLTSSSTGEPVVNLVGAASITDHGNLTGLLGTDHHTQYALTDGSRDITGHQDFLDTIRVANKVTAEAFYVTGQGDLIVVADQGGEVYSGTNKVTFDDNFYLTDDSAGKPVVNFINKLSAITVYQTTLQSISNNTNTHLLFDSSLYNAGGWTTSTNGVTLGTDITVPSGITHVRMTGQCRLGTPSANGRMSVFFRVNGATPTPSPAGNYHIISGVVGPTNEVVSYLTPVTAGDTLSLWVLHVTAAGTLDTTPASTWFSVEGYDYN